MTPQKFPAVCAEKNFNLDYENFMLKKCKEFYYFKLELKKIKNFVNISDNRVDLRRK